MFFREHLSDFADWIDEKTEVFCRMAAHSAESCEKSKKHDAGTAEWRNVTRNLSNDYQKISELFIEKTGRM